MFNSNAIGIYGQYEKTTGCGPRSQSWSTRKKSIKPRTLVGYTLFIADDKGHICDDKKKSPFLAHNRYAGTWDLPCKIPANIGSLMGYSDKTACRLKQEKIDWTNDLKRVWLPRDPKYSKLMQHYRGVPGSKKAIPIPSKYKNLFLENHWELPGFYEDRSVYPHQTVPPYILNKKSNRPILKPPPLSNKTHCFHWQGFSHPKEFSCCEFKDPWTRTFPNCLATVGCKRMYKYKY